MPKPKAAKKSIKTVASPSLKPKAAQAKASTSPKYLVVLSDIHVGSTLAIWPENHKNRYGQVVQPSELQRWMQECWKDGCEWIRDVTKDNYILALNGDLIDGKHHRATEIMTPLVDDQVEACISLLKPLADRARKVVATLGTEVHSGEAEHAIASALKSHKCKDWMPAHNSVLLDIDGSRTEIMHHITTTSRPWLEASGHSIAMNLRRAETSRLGRQAPHVMIRGHRHRAGYFSDGSALTVVAPSWQALSRWAWKVLPGAECQIGFTVLDYSNMDDAKIPQVKFRLYSPSPDKDIVIK